MDLGPPDATDVGSERRRLGAAAVAFAAVAGLAGLDLVGDLREGTATRHALVEGLILLACAVGLGLLVQRMAALRRRERAAVATAAVLDAELEQSRAESARWRTEARELATGLGALIDRQLGRWGLTAAEKEVALFLLKGFSHKEVAGLRRVSEATARQQAAAVYRKAGVTGRHELAAFFLEDLLAPRTDR